MSALVHLLAVARPTYPRYSLEHAADFLREGGPLMYVQLALLAVATALTLERLSALRLRYDVDHRPYLFQIRKLLEAGNRERALQLCLAEQERPVARVLAAILSGREADSHAALEHALGELRPLIERRIHWLSTLARAATGVGVVGMLAGVFHGWQALARTPPRDDAALSAAISSVMNQVTLALLVALLCLLALHALRAYGARLESRLARQVRKLEALVVSPARPAAG